MAQISIPNSTKQKFLLWTRFHLIYQRSFILFQIRPIIVHIISIIAVKPVFFACPLFREFREPDKFTKITGRENLNTVAFQCSRKQKKAKIMGSKIIIDSNAKIKGGQN